MKILKIGETVKMTTTNGIWCDGALGRIVAKQGCGYIICFDTACHQVYKPCNHGLWALPSSFEPINSPKKLMVVN